MGTILAILGLQLAITVVQEFPEDCEYIADREMGRVLIDEAKDEN